jgi:hypothetical protein
LLDDRSDSPSYREDGDQRDIWIVNRQGLQCTVLGKYCTVRVTHI